VSDVELCVYGWAFNAILVLWLVGTAKIAAPGKYPLGRLLGAVPLTLIPWMLTLFVALLATIVLVRAVVTYRSEKNDAR